MESFRTAYELGYRIQQLTTNGKFWSLTQI